MSDVKSELEKRDMLRLSNEEANKLTRECLQTALLQLMKRKPLDKITITELVERSGVSRSAFYRNYTSKDEVLKEYIQNICEHLCQQLQRYSGADCEQWFCDYFQMFQNSSYNGVEYQLNVDALTIFIEEISSRLEHILFQDENKYLSIAKMGALSTLTIYWIKNGMSETPANMAHLCAAILHGATIS